MEIGASPLDQGAAHYLEEAQRFEVMADQLEPRPVATRFRELASEARERAAQSRRD